jgi:hypothetical protein
LKESLSAFILLFVLVPEPQAHAVNLWPFGHKPKVEKLDIPFDALSVGVDSQQSLLETYRVALGYPGSLKDFWEKELAKDNSVQSTFFAVTDALEHRHTKDGKSALSQIEAIEDIAGSEPHKKSAEQFNLKVKWKLPPPGMDSIKEEFTEDAGWASKFSTEHPGESGIQENLGKRQGLHLLFSTHDQQQGHVHIDFRSTGIFEAILTFLHLKFLVPEALRKGHYNPRNADVRATGPENQNNVPIRNLEFFAKTYEDNRILEFAQAYNAEHADKVLPANIPSPTDTEEKDAAIQQLTNGEQSADPAP